MGRVELGSFPLLDQITRREAVLRRPGSTTSELAGAFLDSVSVAELFSWIGVISEHTPQDRSLVHIYLSERSADSSNSDSQSLILRVSETFDDLALALEPELTAQLHIVKESACPFPELKRDLKRWCEESKKRKLVWEQHLL